ncbi:MAG: hypothetical protein RLZ45_1507 [Verrucomicrobiota bacterium]
MADRQPSLPSLRPLRYPPQFWRCLSRYGFLVSGFTTWAQFLGRKWGRSSGSPLRMRTRTGLTIHVPIPLLFAFKDIFLHRAYAPPELLGVVPEQPVVLDLGANAGFFSLFAFHVRPGARCLSFEPMPDNFEILEENRRLQGPRDWRTFNQAVSSTAGMATLRCPEDSGPSTVSTLRSDGTGGHARTFEVRTRTLGEILETEAGGCCDWLKIDVEGFEYEILHALPREGFRRIRTLAIEAEPVDASLKNRESLARFLVDMDFDVLLADDAVLYAVNRSYQPRS